MNTSTWTALAQVAGLGGIAIGTFLVLFREIIRKKIFPTLTKPDGYRLMRLITLCVWSVALVGVAAWTTLEMKKTNADKGTVTQSTTGSGSPAVNDVAGDVDITVRPEAPKQ